MNLGAIIEGPLLYMSFAVFTAGIIFRTGIFFFSIFKDSKHSEHKWSYRIITSLRSLVPYHNAAKKRPVYAALRYAFHICLITVPVWLWGHVFLWGKSRLAWTWISIPDHIADYLTLIMLFLATWFFLRRILFKEIRLGSSPKDFLFLVLTALPFLTGYILSHDTLDSIPVLQDNMLLIHILCGEAMLIMIAFQFVVTRLNKIKCIGCAACEANCPTGTLETSDIVKERIFNYSHYRCICCGSCVDACPEDAAELRHELSFTRLFHVFSKQTIQNVPLLTCERCGNGFAPEPQITKVGETIEADYLGICHQCKKKTHAEAFYKLAPKYFKQAGS